MILARGISTARINFYKLYKSLKRALYYSGMMHTILNLVICEHLKMFNFDEKTNNVVQRVITSAYHSKQRLRIVLGDIETGEDWLEECDIIGTIGRSTGTIKKPLLINNSRSMGGCAILTSCILKIVNVKTKRVIYEASNYKKPILVKCASAHKDYMYDVYHVKNGNNVLHARFKTEKKADNYIEFMQCKRMAK